MTTMSKEEILQAILDKKQLQEWDGIAEKFFNITDQQALSNIVHGKVCTIRELAKRVIQEVCCTCQSKRV